MHINLKCKTVSNVRRLLKNVWKVPETNIEELFFFGVECNRGHYWPVVPAPDDNG
jgi:hypothetical protein